MTGKIFRSSFAVAAAVLLVSAVLLLAVHFLPLTGAAQALTTRSSPSMASLRKEMEKPVSRLPSMPPGRKSHRISA